ncbi:MAG: dTDP-4-dehydrorhamnose reductase [Rhodomicrobium sp.]|nr:dTDP-4-dehydrorhamnose reductase [Rhodomicrobium sp.]
MKILLIGADGQLGREIRRSQLPPGATLIGANRKQLDLARPGEIAAFVSQIAPDLVINAAAYTAVDRAEDEADLAFAINRDAAGALARAAARRSAPIVHISTDYVFNGRKESEWSEDDSPDPINVYGASKLAGEIAVAAANPHHLILRVSWLYSVWGHNFLRTMLKLGHVRSRLSIVNDQIGRPTSASDVSRALIGMALQTMNGEGEWGLYHLSNSGTPTSWHGFASAIFCKAAPWSGMPPILDPISSQAYGARAARPQNSVLGLQKVERVFGLRPRSWQAALAEVVEALRREDIEMRLS